jgi:exonuclease III
MNDDPYSPHLEPLVGPDCLELVDALSNVAETREPKKENEDFDQPPDDGRWTSRHRHTDRDTGEKVTEFRLFDQIWVSPGLADNVASPMIDRRTKHGGDGSDHDPAWITLTGL